MKINELLTKMPWERRLPPTKVTRSVTTTLTPVPLGSGSHRSIYLTQDDFLNELYPSSHLINSCEYRSNRPLYKWVESQKRNIQIGWEPVERVSVGIQQAIRRHKKTHTFGNELEFRNVGDSSDGDRLKSMLAYWDMTGMKDALMAWSGGFFGTGDSAIYLYRDGDRIYYKIFSYENGDLITQKGDKFIRLFVMDNKKAVEIYDNSSISIWVEDANVTNKEFMSLLGVTDPSKDIQSEDGWTRVQSINHGLSRCPVIYHREKDVCWGNGQDNIDRLERILSDLGENNRYYAFQILFLTGGVVNLPDTKWAGKIIGSKSENGKAEILQPADASNSFTIDLEKNMELLWESTGTTVINIEDLKGGDQSGAYIVNLYFRSVQWSTEKIADLRPDISKIVEVYKELVGLIVKDITGYMNMKVAWSLSPFVPHNKMEEVTLITQQVGAGIMSKETGAEISPDTSVNEYSRLQKEKEAEMAPKEVTPPIDNKLK